jgi:hypothetical protein
MQPMKLKIEGLDRIEKMLNRMPKRVAKKVVRGSLRAGARVVVLAIRDEIDRIPDSVMRPSGRRRFRMSIGTVRKREGGQEWVEVGARTQGVKNRFPEAPIWEFGKMQTRYTKKGQSRGMIQQTPVHRRGWDRTRFKAVDETTRETVERTIKEMEKLLKS